VGDLFYQNNIEIIFGIPNARMSRYPYFQDFRPLPRLDKSVSGIPNAMPNQSAVAMDVAADADLRLPLPGTPIESAGQRGREARVCHRD
jgi:hypothetical protein